MVFSVVFFASIKSEKQSLDEIEISVTLREKFRRDKKGKSEELVCPCR